MEKKVTKSLEETHALAAEFLRNSLSSPLHVPRAARVFGLYGDLGSGKTAFVQGIAKALGIMHPVTSPTFVIQKRYELPEREAWSLEHGNPALHATSSTLRHLIHIDAYRFSEGKDMAALRWEEIVADPGNIVFLEWPEIVESALPRNLIPLKFKFIDETTREIELPEF